MSVDKLKVQLIGSMGSDLTVCNSARVSFDKTSQLNEYGELSEGDKKLINYLASHKHMSPFGHCFVSFKVDAPVFVRAQLVKHKFLRVNEISRRYVDSEPEFYTPDEWRMKAANKKQGSSKETLGFTPHILDENTAMAIQHYKHLLGLGVAPEMARIVLPQSMMTSWWWSGSLDAFAAMCVLRCKPDAQYETRVIAEQVSSIMSGLFPKSWEALMNA